MTASLHQFLPALLEIQASPPNPLARRLLAAILAFVVIAVAWACIGKVDVVSVAEGRIIPSARVKQIQPLQRGVVAEIRVQEGQAVQAGEVLVVLDRTGTGADRASVVHEMQAAEETLARQRALLALLDKPSQNPLPRPLSREAGEGSDGSTGSTLSRFTGEGARRAGEGHEGLNPAQQALLEQQYQQFTAQQAALQSQRDNRVAEREVNKAMIRKLEATLPVITQRAANTKGLADKKLAMENDYLALEELRLSQEHDLAAAKARDVQLAAAVKEAEKQLAALLAQTRAEAYAAVVEAERQWQALQEQLVKAESADGRQVLTAPVAGRVKDLAINTVGGVVLEAQQLMLVVPDDEQLEVEAWLPNKDIGFVREGAQAVVKVHTFPFSKYGTIPATVVRLSDDASLPEGKKTAEPSPAGAVFSMGLVMERNTLLVDGREVKLAPGMQVTAEIITHQRRLIEYFFSPLKKQLQESVRER